MLVNKKKTQEKKELLFTENEKQFLKGVITDATHWNAKDRRAVVFLAKTEQELIEKMEHMNLMAMQYKKLKEEQKPKDKA